MSVIVAISHKPSFRCVTEKSEHLLSFSFDNDGDEVINNVHSQAVARKNDLLHNCICERAPFRIGFGAFCHTCGIVDHLFV